MTDCLKDKILQVYKKLTFQVFIKAYKYTDCLKATNYKLKK